MLDKVRLTQNCFQWRKLSWIVSTLESSCSLNFNRKVLHGLSCTAVQQGGGSVMMWGCITSEGHKQLEIVEGTINTAITILKLWKTKCCAVFIDFLAKILYTNKIMPLVILKKKKNMIVVWERRYQIVGLVCLFARSKSDSELMELASYGGHKTQT